MPTFSDTGHQSKDFVPSILNNEFKRLQSNHLTLFKISNAISSGSNDIRIEVRIQDLFTLNNDMANIEPFPGIIEMDILNS
ncbi:MAG TPA: hypothetical protein VD710_10235 [Nitrososphaeraceae archaeon]|nr:hypothetical protein [Nitrososphaeraceae archaeon]